MIITIHHPDRNIDYTLSVEPRFDDAGRYVEPNRTKLLSGVVWIEAWGCYFRPESERQARLAGIVIESKMLEEINAAVREEIERSREPLEVQ